MEKAGSRKLSLQGRATSFSNRVVIWGLCLLISATPRRWCVGDLGQRGVWVRSSHIGQGAGGEREGSQRRRVSSGDGGAVTLFPSSYLAVLWPPGIPLLPDPSPSTVSRTGYIIALMFFI